MNAARDDRHGPTRTDSGSGPRLDAPTSTGTAGLTNTRTRLVGARTGAMADFIVSLARIAGFFGRVIGRIAARISSVITPLGWVVAVGTPLSFLIGYRLNLVEGVAIGWAAVVLVVVAVLSLVGRSAFEMRLDVAHRTVVVGEPATAGIVVINPARRRVLGATAEIPVGAGLAEVAVPGLRAGGIFEHDFAIPTGRRGIVQVGPVRTIKADPVGLVRRELQWTERVEVVVHPRTIAVPSSSTGLIRDLEGSPTRDLTPSDVSFHALREYQPGDDRRYIHWKSTAKTGTYMVRQFEQTRRSHLVVGLSLAQVDYADDDEFELAVSVAGSLGVRAIRDGRTVSVVVSEKTPEFAKRKVFAVRPLSTVRPDRLLDDLAVIQTAPTALNVRDVARVIADTVTGVSIAFLVSGSNSTLSELRAAAAAFPPDVEVVSVVCSPDSAPGLRRVPGLNLLRVGFLDDLRSALARAAAVA